MTDDMHDMQDMKGNQKKNWQRYSRQMLYAPIGQGGQQRLSEASVLIIGMGALGTVLANHMVRAGVGRVRFVDRDYVEMSNLQRQMLFDEEDAAQSIPKAIAAERKLSRVNSDVKLEGIVADVTSRNIESYAADVDMIMDGTDNFQTRFLMNDVAFYMGIPFVYGGAVSSRGMQATFVPGQTPCLRCLIADGGGAGETCDTVGVLAPVVDMVASYQSVDALKWLSGNREQLRKSIISFDVWSGVQHQIKFGTANEHCKTCQDKEYPALNDHEEQVTSLCGRETIQIAAQEGAQRDLNEWETKLSPLGPVQKTPFLLRFDAEGLRLILFPDGRTLIQGTEDVSHAKSVYARYIGM